MYYCSSRSEGFIVTMEAQPHVLIIGAGITSLLLAQALESSKISFTIYECDPNVFYSDPGWGLAIHWAKSTLLDLLPKTLQDRLLEANVDPEAASKGDYGEFSLFSLANGQRLFENLTDNRIRVSRERLRALLMSELYLDVRDSSQPIELKFH
jgi:2-polyprenyl-6-methoxyphenol hydroxylase-like FAD-dependent oxidoreductase